jgi:hypothetical protein
MAEQSMEVQSPYPAVATKLIAGAFLAVLGLLLTADNMDYFNAEPLLRWWPVVLIAIALVKLSQPGSHGLAILLLVAGSWILLYNLDVIRFTIFDLWPIVLIGIGLNMVMRTGRAGSDRAAGDDRTSATAIFGERKLTPTSSPYHGGRLAAFLGSCELDLTRVEFDPDRPAVVEAITFWGGISIVVPEGCDVIGEVMPIMGGFEVKTAPVSEPRRQLVVRGLALMAGVDVKSADRRKS